MIDLQRSTYNRFNSIQSFIDHASSFGFFLHFDRFLVSLRASIPPTDHSPVPAALVHVVYLLGVVFSNDPVLKQQESQILTRALQSLTPALDPARIIYALQAEVLLSNYLFHKGRVFEGGYHSAAAVSIAVACRLHKLRSAVWPAVTANAELSLPAPRDDVEEGERTMAFWNVFVLDRCWAMCLQSSSVLIQEASANMQIDTPWPLKMANYEQVGDSCSGRSEGGILRVHVESSTSCPREIRAPKLSRNFYAVSPRRVHIKVSSLCAPKRPSCTNELRASQPAGTVVCAIPCL